MQSPLLALQSPLLVAAHPVVSARRRGAQRRQPLRPGADGPRLYPVPSPHRTTCLCAGRASAAVGAGVEMVALGEVPPAGALYQLDVSAVSKPQEHAKSPTTRESKESEDGALASLGF